MDIETETDKLLQNDDDHEEMSAATAAAAAASADINERSKLKQKEHVTDDSSESSDDTEEGADKPIISSLDSDDEEDSPNLSNSNLKLNKTLNKNDYEQLKQVPTETVQMANKIDNISTTSTTSIATASRVKKMAKECQSNDNVNEPTTATTFIKVIETCADEAETFNDEDFKLKTLAKPNDVKSDSPNQSLEFFYSANDLFEYEHVVRRHESRTPDVESGYFEKSDSLYSKEEFEARCSSRQPSQYDQTISESLHNQLNRFDLLIETIDQRNAINVASNANERGYWSTIFGQASEIETYDEMSQEKSNFWFFLCYSVTTFFFCLFVYLPPLN